MRRAAWLLGLLLAACSATLTVPLPDQVLDLPGLTDTAGQVAYPKEPLSFDPPPVSVIRGIRVEGILEASLPLNATIEFYARTQDPKTDPSCQAFASFYLCPVGPGDEKAGEAAFQGSTQAAFTLQGNRLLEGLRAGRFFLGLKASGLPAGPLRLTFKNMKAYLTVGL